MNLSALLFKEAQATHRQPSSSSSSSSGSTARPGTAWLPSDSAGSAHSLWRGNTRCQWSQCVFSSGLWTTMAQVMSWVCPHAVCNNPASVAEPADSLMRISNTKNIKCFTIKVFQTQSDFQHIIACTVHVSALLHRPQMFFRRWWRNASTCRFNLWRRRLTRSVLSVLHLLLPLMIPLCLHWTSALRSSQSAGGCVSVLWKLLVTCECQL